MSCGVGHRLGSDLALQWLWCRQAAAAPFQPLAWELLCAVGAVLKYTHTHTHVPMLHEEPVHPNCIFKIRK